MLTRAANIPVLLSRTRRTSASSPLPTANPDPPCSQSPPPQDPLAAILGGPPSAPAPAPVATLAPPASSASSTSSASSATAAAIPPGAATITAWQQHGLTVTFALVKHPANAAITEITAIATNNNLTEVSDFSLQVSSARRGGKAGFGVWGSAGTLWNHSQLGSRAQKHNPSTWMCSFRGMRRNKQTRLSGTPPLRHMATACLPGFAHKPLPLPPPPVPQAYLPLTPPSTRLFCSTYTIIHTNAQPQPSELLSVRPCCRPPCPSSCS